MKSNMLRWFAIVLILEIGLIHILAAQGAYEESAYLGYLFVANFFGALIAAFGIYHRQVWGWMLGLLIATGSIAGYLWSRTLGMPGMYVEEWFSPYGIVSLTAEGAFMLLAVFRPWNIPTTAFLPQGNPRLRYALLAAGLLMVSLVGVATYQWDRATQWDVTLAQADYQFICTLDQAKVTPPTTVAELEEKYGVRISLVAISMMNSIVDVRIKIIDPAKANELLHHQAALLVDQQAMVLAPDMHSHHTSKLKVDKIIGLYFPTQQIVRTGSHVNLVFGAIVTEPFVVR